MIISSQCNRAVSVPKQAVPQRRYKLIIREMANLFIQLVTVRRIWDTQCGFKPLRGEAVERIVSQTEIES